uniref:Ig-like domain-containing protein n=1 Tax=Emticicia sp. TaxID=1930953 RepID=UPI0037538BBA
SLTINVLPTLNIGTRACSANLLTYSVSYTSDGVVTSSVGTVSAAAAAAGIVSGIPTGTNVIMTATSNTGCVVTQTISSPTCTCPLVNAPVSGGNQIICLGQIIPFLTANVGNGEVVEWYDAISGGNLLATGSSYTPSVATGGIFYAQAKNTTTNCVSATRTAISLTINALPILNVGTSACSTNLLTYSVSYTSDGVLTSSVGTVSAAAAAAGIVSGIPTGTNIILTATGSTGCVVTQTVTSPNCSCPTVNAPVSGGNQTICQSQTIPPLTVSVGTDEAGMPAIVEWYDAPSGGNLLATGSSYTPNVAIGGIFYAQAKNTITNCVSSARTAISLTINALPTLIEGTKTCSPDLLTYSVSFTSDATNITAAAGIVSGTIVKDIPKGMNVEITATSSTGCQNKINVTAPSCVCPTVTSPISGGDKTICKNETIPTLSVTVGTGEIADWYDASIGGTLLLANSIIYTPSIEQYPLGGVFYAETRNTTNNCLSDARTAVKLIINPIGATPTIIASKNPLILGETATLSITNCIGIITWNTGESGMNISVTPTATTEYSAICTANGGCIGGNGKITVNVSVPKIEVKASPTIVCIGGSTTLSMTGCPSNDIYWTSPEYGRRNEITPLYNGIVQAGSFTGHCVTSAGESTTTIGIDIRQAQDFQIIASRNSVILGESTILSTTGCDGVVSWQNGQANGNPITVWPTNRYTDYVAECISPNACGGKGKITIEVKPPIIQATGKDVCWGSTATLGQSGCTTSFYWVVWHNDDFMDAKPIENPNSYLITQKTNFRVMCSTSVGEGAGDITINPISLPNKPDIGSERTTYFLGETVRIGTGGCNGSVRWSTGENDINTIEVKPRRSSKYSVTCVGGYGCTNSNEIEITMKTPSPTAIDQIICYGDTVKLVSGCMTGTEVHWTKNWMDIPNRVEVPEGFQERITESNTYAVSCYDAETGWSEAVAIKVTVKAKITPLTITAKGIEKTAIIVKGETIELFASACNRTEWRVESVSMADTVNKIQVKPLQTTIYHARCFVDGCYSEWNQFKIYVRPKMPVVTASADTLCIAAAAAGSSTSITAKKCEDGGLLVWLNNQDLKDLSFTVSPKSDITYKAICVGFDSTERRPLVSDTTTTFIKVYQTPKKPMISGNLIILDGEKTTLIASGCDENLLWNTGEKSQSITVRPEKNTVYSAICGIWQCVSDTASVKVRVRPRRIEIETSNGIRGYSITDTLCLNKQLTISKLTSCNGTIVWSNGQSGEKIEVTGTLGETQKYSLYCINADNEKSDESTATIAVLNYNINEAIAYPNPTSGKLYIKSKGCIDGVKLILYSQRGEILYEGGGQERYLDSIVIDLFNLPSETYILYIVGTDGNKPVTLKKRIIKVNN